MDVALLFNKPNMLFWGVLGLTILGEGVLFGKRWPEQARWLLGYGTLFGLTLVMVWGWGWDGTTWAVLAVAAGVTRLSVEWSDLGWFWRRRENQRWTTAYILAWLVVLAFILNGSFELRTWMLMLGSLGVCGMTKTGWESARDAYRARDLRRQARRRSNRGGNSRQ